MKIVTIGDFDEKGMPTGWWFDMEGSGATIDMPGSDSLGVGALNLALNDSYVVTVGGVEMVEWTQKRREAVLGKSKK